MNESRKTVMAGLEVIAKPIREKATQQGNAKVLELIQKLFAALEEKPDSYFFNKVNPELGLRDPSAFQKVWREVASEVGNK